MTFASYFQKYDKATKTSSDTANSVAIKKLVPLDIGGMAFMGGSASYLVQTPGAWYRRTDQDWRGLGAPGGSGAFFAVLNQKMNRLLFSSAMPACELRDLCETPNGVAVVSTTWGISNDYQSPPTVNAVQSKYAGGRTDGHIVLMERPE
jgi:hypothetical protein